MTRHTKTCTQSTKSSDTGSAANTNIPNLFQKYRDDNAHDSITEDDVKDAVLDFFIAGNIPFNQADSPHLQKIISMIRIKGKRVVINRKNVRGRLTKRAAQAKQDLKDELAANSSRCSLALDGWTSRINNSYMGMILVAYKVNF
jgi:hypothetical protein